MSLCNNNEANDKSIENSEPPFDRDTNDTWQLASNKNQTKSHTKNMKKKQKNYVVVSEETNFIDDIYNTENVEIVRNYVSQKLKCMIILRGCPGSGKSTLANQIKFDGVIASADTFFINDKGAYVYNPLKLTDAHIYCRTKVNEAFKNKVSPIVIDNTNLKGWEFKSYAKLAFQNNYQVELMEPNTPWKYKASQLAAKNIHLVQKNKIEKLLIDFEKNIDIKILTGIEKTVMPRSKPGAFIKNFDSYFIQHDWGAAAAVSNDPYEEDTNKKSVEIKKEPSPESLFRHSESLFRHSEQNHSESLFRHDKSEYNSKNKINEKIYDETDEHKIKLNESKELLKSMISFDVEDEILLDFLTKYNNDVNIVTNILLDSMNFDDTPKQKQENLATAQRCVELPISATASSLSIEHSQHSEKIIENYSDLQSLTALQTSIDSLKTLCIKEMDKLENNIDNSNEPILNLSPKKNDDNILNSSPKQNNNNLDSSASSINSYFTAKITRSNSDSFNITDFNNKKEDDDPILKLNVNQNFLSSLIQLFGDNSDEAYLEKNQNIEIGVEMAFQLYSAWKKNNQTTTTPLGTNQNIEEKNNQIEKDEQLSKELFDQINMRDPIECQPAYFSDKGINAAQNSLRQIMAEEMAEQLKQERMPKQNKIQSNQNLNLAPTVDFTKVLSNFDSTPINQQTKYNIKNNLHSKEKNLNNSNKIDYYNTSISNFDLESLDEATQKEYRYVANKYFNLRADFFKKAGEAFKRGWGGVASYYAEMGHEQTLNAQQSNEIASVQTFLNNNPDIQNSNNLDLHGLQVREAINVLKQVMAEKKQELATINSKRQKGYLFVITGFGHNSENGAKLRPNIINYLNQNQIRYTEPNIGLLKIDLLNNN